MRMLREVCLSGHLLNKSFRGMQAMKVERHLTKIVGGNCQNV